VTDRLDVGLLDELRKQCGYFTAMVEEHLTAAQDEVTASGAKDHDSLRFIDACADAIYASRRPFWKRAQTLTALLAVSENVEA
jgi:hypothetical protein